MNPQDSQSELRKDPQDELEHILSNMAFRCAGGITHSGRKEYMPAKLAIEAYVTTRVKEAERLARIDELEKFSNTTGANGKDLVYGSLYTILIERIKALTTKTNGKEE